MHSNALFLLSTCTLLWGQWCAFFGLACAYNWFHAQVIGMHTRLGWSKLNLPSLTKWEVDQMGIDKVEIDKVGTDKVGINNFVPAFVSYPWVSTVWKYLQEVIKETRYVLPTECDKNQQYLISTSNIFSGSFKCLMNCTVKKNSYVSNRHCQYCMTDFKIAREFVT